MAHSRGIVIIGAGHAGFQTARSLRDRAYEGPITLIDDNDAAPYQRPPLSKAFLLGDLDEAGLGFAPDGFYDDRDITVLTGTRVRSVDRDAQTVTLEDDREFGYDHLVLATGARPRPFTVPGADAQGVHVLRRLDDARALKPLLHGDTRVVVIGAGFIGLEFVSVALAKGVTPTVIEFAPRVLGRAASEAVGGYFLQHYRDQGVTVQLGRGVTEIHTQDGRVTGVTDTEGDHYPADLVVVGVGVEPETTLAEQIGLKVDNGIVVSELLTTSDPHISAVGDCCNYPSQTAGTRVRLESVQNATDHGRAIAATLTGDPKPYAEVPWFWSDQGPKKLQIVGLNFGYDREIVRGDVHEGKFSVFMYRGDELVAVDSVDQPTDHMAVRRMMMTGKQLPADDAANPAFDLKAFSRS